MAQISAAINIANQDLNLANERLAAAQSTIVQLQQQVAELRRQLESSQTRASSLSCNPHSVAEILSAEEKALLNSLHSQYA
ncbi:hypothetical protein [Paraferrimonas sedimenticola]|uniref:Uncharacterized protein n=1 Tax=Paraferrimonas sedimenticola TaxID=375674 RepID=A0AA37RWY7_9GAMM|nr:hypothetical protein [Paraferrimonas sedimenticola]GLP96780.1 hypothetical protein GCM10007895_20860 [Paraferrimonas sedimenticola]